MTIRVTIEETCTFVRDYTLDELQAIIGASNGTPKTIIDFVLTHQPHEVDRDLKTNSASRRVDVDTKWTAEEVGRPPVGHHRAAAAKLIWGTEDLTQMNPKKETP